MITSSRSRPSPTRVSSAGTADPGDVRVVGRRKGLERAPAAFEVERRDPVDDDHGCPRGTLERPAVVLAAARPRERGAVRVGRIGGGEDVDRWGIAVGGDRPAQCPQSLDRAGERELGRAEAVDEVAAPDPARFLERPQDRVDAGKAAVVAFGHHGLPDHDAVAVEEGEAERVEPLGRRAGRLARRATSGRPPRVVPAR